MKAGIVADLLPENAQIDLLKAGAVDSTGSHIKKPLTTFVLNDRLGRKSRQKRQPERVCEMGIVIEFPAEATSRRLGSTLDGATPQGRATVLILPVIRIERQVEETSGDRGPEEGTAPGRRRRRR